MKRQLLIGLCMIILLIPIVLAEDFATGDASQVSANALVCKGYDPAKIKDTYLHKCERFKDLMMKYYKQYKLDTYGVDFMQLYITSYFESGCQTREEMVANNEKRKAAGKGIIYKTWQGGPMQVDFPCYWSYVGGQNYKKGDLCPTLEKQIEEGVKEFTQKLVGVHDYAKKKGVTLKPEEALWLTWYSYNRGLGAGQYAIREMANGKTIQQACDASCNHFYGTGSKRNNYKFFCTQKGSIGIQYAGKLWDGYKKQCEKMGGTIAQGSPVVQTSGATPAAGVSAGSLSATSRPTRAPHPAFSVPYSVDPSFMVTAPYDFSIYENITTYLPQLDRCLADMDCLSSKITLIDMENPDFKWLAKTGGNMVTLFDDFPVWEKYCEPPGLNALTSLAESISECMKSADNGCACTYRIPVGGSQDSLISLGKWEEMKDAGFGAFMKPFADWETRKLKITNSGGGITLSPEYKDVDAKPQTVNGATLVKMDDSLQADFQYFDPKSKIIHYRPSDTDKSIDIYKINNQNFSLYAQGKSPAGDKECKINNRVFKFCIVSKDKFTAYDIKKNRFGLLNVAIKFGYLFRSKIKEVQNFEVKDNPISQKTNLVSWDEMPGVDVNQYTVYRFEDTTLKPKIEEAKPSELKTDENLTATMVMNELFTGQKETITDMNWPLVPICEVESGDSCSVVYPLITKVQGQLPYTTLTENTLYYIEAKKKYFAIVPETEDGKIYTYAITATDTNGEESTSFTFPKVQENSKDDLPPALPEFILTPGEGKFSLSITPPERNIDGTQMEPNETKWFRAYCFPPETDPLDLSSARPMSNTANYQEGSTSIQLDVINTECIRSGNSAQVIVVATDKNNQEFRGKVTSSSAQEIHAGA